MGVGVLDFLTVVGEGGAVHGGTELGKFEVFGFDGEVVSGEEIVMGDWWEEGVGEG